MSPGWSRSAVWDLENSLSPVLITLHRLCRVGLEGWHWLSGDSLAQSHPSALHLKNTNHNFQLVEFVREVRRCIPGVFKRCSWTKKFWEGLGGVLGIPGSAAVGGDNMGGREGRRLHCSAASVTFEFWAPWWLWQHRDCWRRAGAAGRTVHYCYTKALLLQLTRSTVVTKGAFLLTNSSKKRSQIAWLVWWEANQLPG